MQDYFLWNGVDCRTYGIHVSELPPNTIPAERTGLTTVEGRYVGSASREASGARFLFHNSMLLNSGVRLILPKMMLAARGLLRSSSIPSAASGFLPMEFFLSARTL